MSQMQGQDKKFSHIKIGGLDEATNELATSADDQAAEQVTVIAAGQLATLAGGAETAQAKSPRANCQDSVSAEPGNNPKASGSHAAVDDELGGPMPRRQKVVLLVCLLALVVTIVFLVRYWLGY